MKIKATAAVLTATAIVVLAVYRYNSIPNASSPIVESPAIPQESPERTLPPAVIEQVMNDAVQTSQPLPDAFFEQPPASLADVGAPASLLLDEDGLLLVNQRLRDVFDHYLTAMGEEPLETIVARIQHHLQREFDTRNTDLAMSLLEGYLQYRNNIGVIINDHAAYRDTSTFDPETIAAVKRDIRDSRPEFLPADAADALFGQEDAYDDYMLEKLRIQADQNLTEQQKAESIGALEQQALQSGAIKPTLSATLEQSRQQAAGLQAVNASEAEIYEARRELLGDDAAERMAAVDAERRVWQERVEEYRRELASIEDYPQAEREFLAEEIRQRHFQGSELVRIRALDRDL